MCQNQTPCKREMLLIKEERPSGCALKFCGQSPRQNTATVLPSCGRNTKCCTIPPIAPPPPADSCGRAANKCCPVEVCCTPVYSCVPVNTAPKIEQNPQRCPVNPCPTTQCAANPCPPARCVANPCPPKRCPPKRCPVVNPCPPVRCPGNSCLPKRPTNPCPPARCATNTCPPTRCAANPCPCAQPDCADETFCTLVNNECGNFGLTPYAKEYVSETGKIVSDTYYYTRHVHCAVATTRGM